MYKNAYTRMNINRFKNDLPIDATSKEIEQYRESFVTKINNMRKESNRKRDIIKNINKTDGQNHENL